MSSEIVQTSDPMRLTMSNRLMGKLRAGHALWDFAVHLKNWKQVWADYRNGNAVRSPLLFRNGLELHFGIEDDAVQVFREIFARRCYAPKWFYRPRARDTVVDLGANIGAFALWAAQAGLRCHSYEPASRTRAMLMNNVAANHYGDLIRVYPFGVGGTCGSCELLGGVSSIHTSMFGNAQNSGMQVETVEMIDLAGVIQKTGESRIELLKIDVEGAEKAIFDVAETMTLEKVQRVVLEFHDHICHGAREAAQRSLESAGMRILKTTFATEARDGGLLYAWRG